MVQTGELPPQTEPNALTLPTPGAEGIMAQGNPEGRRLSRAERKAAKAAFYVHLSRSVLEHAGIELEPIIPGTPGSGIEQPTRPRGFRQKRAVKKAVELGQELKLKKAGLDDDEARRERLGLAKREHHMNWVHVDEAEAFDNVKKLKRAYKSGEISHFDYKEAREHARHYSHPHHGYKVRKFTDEERAEPIPPNKNELKTRKEHDRLTQKVLRIADRRVSSRPSRETMRGARRINNADAHTQASERIHYETRAHGHTRINIVGARAHGREALSTAAGKSADRLERHSQFYEDLAENAEARLDGLESGVQITPRGLRERARARLIAARVASAQRAAKHPERRRHSNSKAERADKAISKLRGSTHAKLATRTRAKRAAQAQHRQEAQSHRSTQDRFRDEVSRVDITGWASGHQTVRGARIEPTVPPAAAPREAPTPADRAASAQQRRRREQEEQEASAIGQTVDRDIEGLRRQGLDHEDIFDQLDRRYLDDDSLDARTYNERMRALQRYLSNSRADMRQIDDLRDQGLPSGDILRRLHAKLTSDPNTDGATLIAKMAAARNYIGDHETEIVPPTVQTAATDEEQDLALEDWL